jgi:hypothetical protein
VSKNKSGKEHLHWVVGEIYPAIMVNTKVLGMKVEPIQMDITPANRELNSVVEIGNRNFSTDEQTPLHTMGIIPWSHTVS